MNFFQVALGFLKSALGKNAVGLAFTALSIVSRIQTEMPNATGKEKRDKAISELLDVASLAGQSIGENAVRLLVEHAVLTVKNKVKSPDTTSVPAPATPVVPVKKK